MCEIDERDVEVIHKTGVHPDGHDINDANQYVLQTSEAVSSSDRLLGVEESKVTVPTGTKFYQGPGLRFSALLSAGKDLDSHLRKVKAGDIVVEAIVHYDTAERLALRGILPATHVSYPRDFIDAQNGLQSLSSHQATSDQLARLQSMVADPSLRAALPPTLVNAVEFCFNTDVVHSCDLTGEEETEVWQSNKRVKQEVSVVAEV